MEFSLSQLNLSHDFFMESTHLRLGGETRLEQKELRDRMIDFLARKYWLCLYCA